ncbi:hypothetical protein HADU_06594 [Acinetobacter sp. HA]|uniref:hypothetical protein n=1 Tax=Acinetobacter sp. HA TaxID=1173062 RepID=UPI000263E695|nr:hypothetical protein [Acinetobacter sp. HA]EIM39494.1 hypothetical protein HADU_06594 [Acinetobacter sp. HA]
MTMPISFFKKSDELERINKLHAGSGKSKVVVVTINKDDSPQYESLFKNLRGSNGMEKQTN